MSSQPRAHTNDEGFLVCPKCQETYLHQGTVDVGHRRREDQSGPARIVVACDGTTERSARDYWGRRQDIRVDFTCEFCGPIGQLVIAQHKGLTILEWALTGAIHRSSNSVWGPPDYEDEIIADIEGAEEDAVIRDTEEGLK